MRSLSPACLLLALSVGAGCSEPAGSVELAWVFVDRDGDPIFPGGVFSADDEPNTCDLPATSGDELVSYALRVELEICDPECTAGCDADECLVSPRRQFACNDARANEPAVPASPDPYQFTVRPVVHIPSIPLECRDPSCLAVPAPRQRIVEAGRTVDLAVYQISINVDHQGNQPLDLDACGCG